MCRDNCPLRGGNFSFCHIGCRILFYFVFNYFTNVAVPLLASVAIPGVLPFSVLPSAPPPIPSYSIIKEFDTGVKPLPKTATVKPKEKRFVCTSCSDNEKRALDFLQDKGIKDKNALATIMGNIRQESTFQPLVCEGGDRTGYHGCRSGGFGILQWTTENRYRGLGQFARLYGGNPSTLETQLHYMINEEQWKQIEARMKKPGKSIYQYMDHAYSWLGWGTHGSRTDYAYSYAKKFTFDS